VGMIIFINNTIAFRIRRKYLLSSDATLLLRKRKGGKQISV